MRLEVGGLIGNQPVAITVALVECVIGKWFDDIEKRGTNFSAIALGVATFDKLLALFLNEFAHFLAACFTKIVCIGERIPSKLLRYSHDRLLVDHESVGVAKKFGKIVVQVVDRFTPVLAIGVIVMHVRSHGARSVERYKSGNVFERGRRQRTHKRSHGATFKLKHADGVAITQHGQREVVIEWNRVDIDVKPLSDYEHGQGVGDDIEVSQPEEVHLEKAKFLNAVHFILSDDRSEIGIGSSLGLPLNWQILGKRFLGNHHRCCVNAVLATKSFEPTRNIDDLTRIVVIGVDVAKI